MEGIEFISNDNGQRVAVIINLQTHRKVWEDFYDSLVARSREKEPRMDIPLVKENLIKQGKLAG